MARPTAHRGSRKLAATIAAALTATMLVAVPAGANAEGSAPQADRAVIEGSLAAVERSDSSLLFDPVSHAGLGEVAVGTGSVHVPKAASEGIVFTNPNGESRQIQLPNSAAAGPARELATGAVAFPGEDSANTVAVTATGVQMLTTIANSQAPTEYNYDLSLAPGERLEVSESGAVIVGIDGAVVLSTGTPWALDANGNAVSTHYKVSGSTLTQVVDHTTSGVAYPVVADPFFIAPWVYRCLVGIGISAPDIARIASMGSPMAILGAFGRGALACIIGR